MLNARYKFFSLEAKLCKNWLNITLFGPDGFQVVTVACYTVVSPPIAEGRESKCFQVMVKLELAPWWSQAVSYTHLDVYKRQVCDLVETGIVLALNKCELNKCKNTS